MRPLWLSVVRLVALDLAGLAAAMGTCAAQLPPTPRRPVDSVIDDILKSNEKRGAATPSTVPNGVNIDAVRAKLQPCWMMTPTHRPLAVSIRVEMSPDATPARTEVLDRRSYDSDRDFRAVADSATRAIMNPRCHPWPLRADNYDTWRVITLRFDGRDR